MIIELHVIHSLPPSNTNRGEDGSPKDATFGGVRRARLSSQAQKRAARLRMADDLQRPDLFSKRSRAHIRNLSERLDSALGDDERATIAQTVFGALDIADFDAKEDRTKVQVFLSETEVQRLVEVAVRFGPAILAADKPDPSKIKVDSTTLAEAVKSLLDDPAAIDVAMFGRMLANRPELNVDGAVSVAHAIATHRTDFEFDFFSSVDELAVDESGASMIDITGFVAPVVYRYTAVDVARYLNELAAIDRGIAVEALGKYLEAFAVTLPSGKQTSYAAYVPPAFVLGVARPTDTINLANAFASPVYGSDLIGRSVEALSSHWAMISERFHTDRNRPTLVIAFPGTIAELPGVFAEAAYDGTIDGFAAKLAQAATE